MPYAIEYSPGALERLHDLTKREQTTLADRVDEQLRYEPTRATRHRKKLRANVLADWELRIGDLRAYYVVKEPPVSVVAIIEIGRKRGNQVFIGGREVTL